MARRGPLRTNPFSLRGRRALVTGANTGIGQAIAMGLADAGATVVCAGRSASNET
ncbi:MAG: SDR family NAD(P)-dependent oxidoreductase, partial [Paracoccaceae bacterium]|nr:SDR family NAD(P)-dependent oxidoreductase [Paracoccaceae bacterium]